MFLRGDVLREKGEETMTEFEHFRDKYCGHMSGTKVFAEGEEQEPVRGCTYKNEVNASCWEDWQPCTLENCPFFQKFDVKRRLL